VADATAGGVAGAGASRRPARLRLGAARRLWLRPSTVTWGMSIAAGPLVCAGDAAAGLAAATRPRGPADWLRRRRVAVTGALDGGASAAGGALGLPVAGGAACWGCRNPMRADQATDVVPNIGQRQRKRIHNLQRTAAA